jgi:hypothetical protein
MGSREAVHRAEVAGPLLQLAKQSGFVLGAGHGLY